MRSRLIMSLVVSVVALGATAVVASSATRPLKNIKPPKVKPRKVVTGNTAYANNGTWRGGAGRAYAFQWQRCDNLGAACTDIAGATQRRLIVPPEAAGGTLRVSVTATSQGQSITAVSLPSSIVLSSAPVNTVLPMVSGRAGVGGRLRATKGIWTKVGGVAYSYQWQRCDPAGAACVDLPGEIDKRFDVSAEDLGQTLRVVVTVTSRRFQTAGSATSAPTAVVSP